MSWEPQTLSEAVFPVVWLNWLFGLGVIEIPIGHPRRILTKIYKIMWVVGYFYLFFWRVPYMINNWIAYEKISIMLVWWINIAVAICSAILSWRNAQDMRNITLMSSKIDDTLETFGVEKQYGKVFRLIVYFITVWLFFVVLLTGIDFLWMKEEFGILQGSFATLLIHAPIVLNSVVDLTFTGLVMCVGVKLRKMNHVMDEVFHSENRMKFDIKEYQQFNQMGKITVAMGYGTRKNFVKHFVETIKHVHLEMVRMAHAINRTYCIQILLELGVQLTLVTGSLYNVYFILMDPNLPPTQRYEKLLGMSLWAIISAIKVVVINGTCASVTHQSRKTARIIRELDGHANQDIRDEVQQFSLQLMLHPLYFTACGFVRLDNEFTRAFTGTITTYLVILIQMSSTPAAIKSLIKVGD